MNQLLYNPLAGPFETLAATRICSRCGDTIAGYAAGESLFVTAHICLDLVQSAERQVVPLIPAIQPAQRLTPRERDVLQLVARGCANKEIAKRLVVEVSTVKNHLLTICRKLEVHNRTEAALRGLQTGEISFPTGAAT